MTVHNHGSEDGEGLACPETRLPDGSLKGKCLMAEDEKKPEPADAEKNRQHATQENGHPISE